MNEFADYLCAYYGYNRELIDIFLMTFSANEVITFKNDNLCLFNPYINVELNKDKNILSLSKYNLD